MHPAEKLEQAEPVENSPVQHTAPDGRASAKQLTHSWPKEISFPQVLACWRQGDLRQHAYRPPLPLECTENRG